MLNAPTGSNTPQRIVSYWPWNENWLSLAIINNTLHWQTLQFSRPLPEGTSIGSQLNGYGDGHHGGVYPGNKAWLWIDHATQALWYSDEKHDRLLHHPEKNHRSGDGLWLNEHTVVWIEENTDNGDWLVWQLCLTSQELTQRWRDKRVLASPTKIQGLLGFISWDPMQMPWDESKWHTLDESNHCHTAALPIGAWSQPRVHNEALYLIGSLEDNRAIYRIHHDDCAKLTPSEHDVGEIEWIRNRQDYCLWQGKLYYAHQRAGQWAWKVIETANIQELPIPWIQHERWHTCHDGPYISGSSLTHSGRCDTHGNLQAQLINNPLPPWEHRLDHLPNDHYTQSWVQYSSGKPRGNIIWLHGGPADVSGPRHHTPTQYYRENGFDVYHINAIGSSGFGKAFRNALQHAWGPGDAEDIAMTLQKWREQNTLRSDKIIINARSSSGWSALHLSPLIRIDAFIFYYPVVDLEATLTGDPFERGYLKQLIGSGPSPAFPLAPLYIFQGKKDIVVPWESLHKWWNNNNPHALSKIEYFEHEGHGFSSSLKETLLPKEIQWLTNIIDPQGEENHDQ